MINMDVETFFNSNVDITNNVNDCIMSSDLRYYLNQDRPYDNRISHSIISNYLKEKEIPKKVMRGSMYYFGIKWKPTYDDDIEYY
jgi:Zn-dependent oligopeptidase